MAWFKAAPCDVLGECLRKMWEACLDAVKTSLGETESLLQVPLSARRCMYEESRCIVLESIYDILEWRLVCSRTAAMTSDPLVYCPVGKRHPPHFPTHKEDTMLHMFWLSKLCLVLFALFMDACSSH